MQRNTRTTTQSCPLARDFQQRMFAGTPPTAISPRPPENPFFTPILLMAVSDTRSLVTVIEDLQISIRPAAAQREAEGAHLDFEQLQNLCLVRAECVSFAADHMTAG